MTVAELIGQLLKFEPDRPVVLDVDLDLCDSDRNILDISEVGDFHPDTRFVFLDAKPLSSKVASEK